jgi:drug/metabolite transporter (DMT)-like permease
MATAAPARPLAGILWMLVTGFCFVTVTAIVKHVGGTIPAPQAAFLRFLLGLVFFLPMLSRPGAVAALTALPQSIRRVAAARAATHTLAVMLWFFAMARIPIADVTAMNYLSPVYTTIGAALFFHEKLAARRIAAIGVAFLGTLIILRPGLRELDPGHLAMVFTAPAFAASYLFAKRLSDEVDAGTVVLLMSIGVTIGLAPFAALVWVPPTAAQLGWLFLVAGFATAGHYAMTRAFAAAPLAVTQPVTFLQLVWATMLGALVFAEPPDPFVMLGGGLIVAAVSFISWREWRLSWQGGRQPHRRRERWETRQTMKIERKFTRPVRTPMTASPSP